MEIAEPISPRQVGDLFGKSERIKVPSYQRRYSWEEEHFTDLWDDLDDIEHGENHFFGTIVFRSSTPHVAQGVNEIDVVDGQQRITTISILLCAIRDYLQENHEEEDIQDRVNALEKSLWLVDRDGDKQGMQLVLGNLDQESYENLVKYRTSDIGNQQILSAYEYFYDQLDKKLDGLVEIRALHDKVMDQLVYVSITAQGHSDAYQLFEAMNNRGLSLSPIDLMKNYLLMESTERTGTDEDRVEDLWGQIIQNIDDLSNLNSPGLTFFRQYFMSSGAIEINEKIPRSKLYEPHFRNIIDNATDIENLLEEIKKQSDLYRKLLNHSIDYFSDSENSELNRLLRDAKTVSITPFTFFLRAFTETDDVNTLKKIIEKSNSLLLRRQICDRNTGPHDTIFNHLSHNAFDSEDPLEYMEKYLILVGRFPSDEQFTRYFKQEDFPRSDTTKYILAKIEEDYYGHGGMEVVESRYQVHIEHILPERAGKNLTRLWLEPFGISEDEHEEFKKRIGNLTLLEENPNIRASNRSLKKEQAYYSQDATDFRMTHELSNIDGWNVERIKERSGKLAEIAAGVWSL